MKGLVSATTLASPAVIEAKHYRDIVSSVQGLRYGMASKYEFSQGELVRIKVGAFRAFIGKVLAVDKQKGTLTVIVEVFGKPQFVELTFLDVEKVA